jgi:hypothetical protein
MDIFRHELDGKLKARAAYVNQALGAAFDLLRRTAAEAGLPRCAAKPLRALGCRRR